MVYTHVGIKVDGEKFIIAYFRTLHGEAGLDFPPICFSIAHVGRAVLSVGASASPTSGYAGRLRFDAGYFSLSPGA